MQHSATSSCSRAFHRRGPRPVALHADCEAEEISVVRCVVGVTGLAWTNSGAVQQELEQQPNATRADASR